MITVNGHIVEPTHFPDGTQQVWKLPEELFEAEHFNIVWKFSAEHELITLLQLSDLIDACKPQRADVSLLIPYLPYGRQDKNVCNMTCFGLNVLMEVLYNYFAHVVVFDPHSTELLDEWLVEYMLPDINKLAANYDHVCFPDAGAAKKYITSKPCVVCEKDRDQETGRIRSYSVPEIPAGSRVLVVDDICDGGATFCLLGQALQEQHVSASLYISHGIFSRGSKGVAELLSYYDEIITTDSCDGVEDYPVTVIPAFNR